MNHKEMAISFLNQIIEEWEAGQEVPQDSPNENGVF